MKILNFEVSYRALLTLSLLVLMMNGIEAAYAQQAQPTAEQAHRAGHRQCALSDDPARPTPRTTRG